MNHEGWAVNAEEQQRSAHIGSAREYEQCGGVETPAAQLQGGQKLN